MSDSTPKAPKAAPKTKSATAVGKEKYATMLVGIGKSREALHAQLTAMADEFGVKVGHLVWFFIQNGFNAGLPSKEAVLASIPAGARSTSKSIDAVAGFWTVPASDGEKVVDVTVIEVARRDAIAGGREFYRYSAGETPEQTAKNRARALAQATRGAKGDLALLGIKGDVKVTTL